MCNRNWVIKWYISLGYFNITSKLNWWKWLNLICKWKWNSPQWDKWDYKGKGLDGDNWKNGYGLFRNKLLYEFKARWCIAWFKITASTLDWLDKYNWYNLKWVSNKGLRPREIYLGSK